MVHDMCIVFLHGGMLELSKAEDHGILEEIRWLCMKLQIYQYLYQA